MFRWITVILKPVTNSIISPKYGVTTTSSQSIKSSENEKKPNFSPKTKTNYSSQADQNSISLCQSIEVLDEIEKPEIRQIIENLKRRENFENGIRNLNELLLLNPGTE